MANGELPYWYLLLKKMLFSGSLLFFFRTRRVVLNAFAKMDTNWGGMEKNVFWIRTQSEVSTLVSTERYCMCTVYTQKPEQNEPNSWTELAIPGIIQKCRNETLTVRVLDNYSISHVTQKYPPDDDPHHISWFNQAGSIIPSIHPCAPERLSFWL